MFSDSASESVRLTVFRITARYAMARSASAGFCDWYRQARGSTIRYWTAASIVMRSRPLPSKQRVLVGGMLDSPEDVLRAPASSPSWPTSMAWTRRTGTRTTRSIGQGQCKCRPGSGAGDCSRNAEVFDQARSSTPNTVSEVESQASEHEPDTSGSSAAADDGQRPGRPQIDSELPLCRVEDAAMMFARLPSTESGATSAGNTGSPSVPVVRKRRRLTANDRLIAAMA